VTPARSGPAGSIVAARLALRSNSLALTGELCITTFRLQDFVFGVILSEASAPFVILNEGSDVTEGKDLGQLRGSEAGTGFESLLPN
jgi:hypothetical protein